MLCKFTEKFLYHSTQCSAWWTHTIRSTTRSYLQDLKLFYIFFQGPYQKGSPGYKHIYFNITSTSLKIWTMTMLAVVLLYETVKFIFSLVVTGNLRLPMFILLASVFYSHYYSWWVFFNYWNDGFFRQWNHQVFFTLTELLSTGFVLYLCNTKNSCGPRHLLPILTIAVVHIVTSSVDQFLHNVLLGKGLPHQIPRDIALMVPDQLHVFIPLWEILRHSKANNIPLKYMFTQAELIASLLGGISMYLVCSSL